jgi:hypothetical protein
MKEFLSNPVVHGVIVLAIAFLVAKVFFKVDKDVEARRRKAIDLSAALKANGMSWVPDLLIDYAVGDYESVGLKLGHVAVDIAKDPNLKAEFDTVFQKLLASKFQDADAKAQLEKMLEDLGHTLTPISPAPSTPDLLAQIGTTVANAVASALPGAPAPNASGSTVVPPKLS